MAHVPNENLMDVIDVDAEQKGAQDGALWHAKIGC